MSGTFDTFVVIDDKALMRKLAALEKRAGGLAPALKNIGEYKVEATQALFDKQEDPQGVKWAALSKRYKEKKKGKKILTETRRLRDSIIYAVRNGNLKIGTNVVYGAPHQFGLDKNLTVPSHRRLVKKAFGHSLKFPVWAQIRAHSFNPKLPARPYLGWNDEDRREIADIVQDHLDMN